MIIYNFLDFWHFFHWLSSLAKNFDCINLVFISLLCFFLSCPIGTLRLIDTLCHVRFILCASSLLSPLSLFCSFFLSIILSDPSFPYHLFSFCGLSFRSEQLLGTEKEGVDTIVFYPPARKFLFAFLFSPRSHLREWRPLNTSFFSLTYCCHRHADPWSLVTKYDKRTS